MLSPVFARKQISCCNSPQVFINPQQLRKVPIRSGFDCNALWGKVRSIHGDDRGRLFALRDKPSVGGICGARVQVRSDDNVPDHCPITESVVDGDFGAGQSAYGQSSRRSNPLLGGRSLPQKVGCSGRRIEFGALALHQPHVTASAFRRPSEL
jgi:hypothetical protein